MVVGWLMIWLLTMEVRGSYPSCGMVELLRPTRDTSSRGL